MKVTRRTGSLVIVLVIFAAIVLGTALAAIAIDKSEIPMLQQHAAEAAVTADGYTHGSNIGRTPSGTSISVNNASAFVTALTVNNSINLQKDIELSSDQVKQICNTEYGGTLYGNGHTITVSFPSTGNAASVTTSTHKSAYGGLVGKLTGAIYDLNFVHTGGQLNVQMRGNNSGFAGGMVGSVEGGTIENVKVELSAANGGRVGFAKESSSGSGWGNINYYVAAGAMAGRIYSGTVKNVTVVNNAWIEAGVYSGSGTDISTKIPGHVGNIAGIIGPVQGESMSDSVTMDNIIVEGNDTSVADATLKGQWTTNLGAVTASLNITVTNFYNNFRNNFNSENNGFSETFANAAASPTLSVTNLYKSANATSVSSSANISGNNTVTIPNNADYSIYFDPQAKNTSNSLVVVKSGVTGGANYTATITGVNNNSYSDHYAFNSAGDTVVFRNLPTAASNWSSGGNFTCTIDITQDQIEVPTMDPLNKWEHGYVTSKTTSGTPINNGTEFENIFRPNGSLNQSGTYYLTDDIAITGFTGKTFGGTLDGNGHTIYIAATNTGMTGQYIGGLVGTLSGTIKNVRVVITTSLTVSTNYNGERAFGLVAGNIKGSGKIENVNAVLQNGVTVTTGGGNTSALGGVSGYMESGTITKTTVQMDGTLNVVGNWSFVAGIVGRLATSNTAETYNFSDIILKGSGKFAGSASGDTNEPKYVAAIAVTSGSFSNKPINLNGFIYALTSKVTDNNPVEGNYSSYGYISRNQYNANGDSNAVSKDGYINDNTYIYLTDNAAYNAINKINRGNNYVDIPATATISTNVAESTIPVTPYFPASSNGNLVLVAGDGTVTVPDLQYTNKAGTAFKSTADGNYKVVTVAKGDINTTTVTLEEPVTPAKPIDDLNQWENGYVASPQTGDEISATDLRNAINNNDDIVLSNDIKDFVGFTHTETYTGILDGNGHTIYIVRDGGASGTNIGGLFSTLTGTVKNLRLVITTGADRSSTQYLGGIAGALNDNAIIENVCVVIPSGVTLNTTAGSVGGVGGIAGGLINGSGETVSISNTTVELQGTLKATANYTFVGGFVGHLNGESDSSKGAINYTNTTFKGRGFLDGVANSGEGVHTAALGIVGGKVSAVNVDGVINSFNGTLSSGRSAYAIIVRNSQDTNIEVEISNVYTFGTVTSYDGSMAYGKPVSPSNGTKVISTKVSGTSTPVTPYFPASSGSDNLVLVAGNGSDSVTTPLAYNNGTDSFVSEAVTVGSAVYQVVTVAKENVTTGPVSLEIAAVNDPEWKELNFTYNGRNNGYGVDDVLEPLYYGATLLELNTDYEIKITLETERVGLVRNDKAIDVGQYIITVTLKNGYHFADNTTEKSESFRIHKAKLTLTGVIATDREYDGTTSVEITGGTLSGVCDGDSVSVTLGKAYVYNADVGENKAVNYTASISNEFRSNYDLSCEDVTVNITPKKLSFTTAENLSFPFADTTGTAITDQNLTAGNTYSLTVEGFVGTDSYTLTVADVAESSYITERTKDGAGSKFLTVGEYTVTLTVSKNYIFGSNSTFTFAGTQHESANTWVTEYARGGWTYYSDPSKETAPVARFGSPAITYSNGNEGFSKTTAKGTYTVNVSVAETDNYGALTEEYSFTVSALKVNVALSAAGTVYDGQAYEASNILITLTATVNGTETTYTSADNSSDDVSTLLGSYGWQYSAEGVTETTDGLPTNAGTYTLYIYNFSNINVNVTGTLYCTATIDQAEQLVNVSIDGWTYGDQANEPDIDGIEESAATTAFYSGTTNAGVKYDSETAPTAAGTYTVTVSWKETTNYKAGKAEPVEFTIAKASLTDGTKDFSTVYDGAAHGLNIVLSGFVNNETMETAGAVIQYSANGQDGWTADAITAENYTATPVSVYYKVSFNNYETVTGNHTVSISKKGIGISITAPDHVYDGSDQIDLKGVIAEGDVFEGDDVSLVLPKGIARMSDVGQNINVTVNTITLSGKDAANYTIANQPGTVTVNIIPKVLSFTAVTTSFLFANTTGTAITDKNLTAGNTYSVKVTGFVETDPTEAKAYTLTVADPSYITERTADGDGSKFLTVGTYTVTLNISGNYTFGSDNTFTFEVTKNENANTWITEYARGGWTYYSKPAAVTMPVARFGSPAITYSNGNEGFSNTTAKGTYTVKVTVEGTDNYGALTKEYSFTVSALDVTVALSAVKTEYDGQAYEASNISITLTATVNGEETTYTSAKHPDNVSDLLGSYRWKYSADSAEGLTETKEEGLPTNAGTYTLYIYNFSNINVNVTGTLYCTATIDQAEQLVNVSIDGWTYGDQANEPDIDGIEESAATTAVYSGTTNAGVKYDSETAPTAAGTYTVTVSWAETTNYTAGSVESAEFTVEKAKLTKPSANVDPFVYTGAAQTYTPDGFDSDTMTISGNVQTNADTYTVTVSVTDKYNYIWADDTDTDITFNFVIGKAEQSVNVSIDGWTYGDTAKEYEVEGIMENAGYTVNYSGDGYSADTAPVNAGNYTLTITVDATANYNAAAASAEFTIAPKELHVSDSVMIIEAEYGELTLDDISSDEAILAVIGDYTAIFDGLVYDDVLTPDDFTLTAAEDYSDLVADGFMAVDDYSIKVALNDSLTNYVVPESGLENITFRVVKAANSIGRYSVSGWTYLDVRSEYIPAFSAAVFGTVVGSFFDENGTEIAVDDFGATTPAGTYTFRLSVAETDNYSGATRTGSFVVDKRIVVAELTATDVTYDGAVYDGISYTLSFDVSDYIGTVGYEYSENGSAFRKGLPTDAGNYSVRIGEYSDSENIELRAETVDFQINPAPMHFTVTGVDGASIEYGTAIDDIDKNALIVSVIPDSYVGDFEFTVSLITANGTAYRPGLYAGTTLYATVDITLDSNNYYPVVDTAIEMLPKVNITKVSHDMAFEINDEIITDGSSAAVIEGSANTVIDAISYYMAINDIQYYEYHITVDGEEYSRDFVWAPGSHTVEVRLSGNHEGSTQFTVVIEEDPDAVDRAPFTPKTVVGEVLESINFTWASAVSIAFGVAVAVLIILFFGLRRAKRK